MRRNWVIAAVGAGIAAVVVAVGLVSVTDDDSAGIETTVWASSVCTSLSEWRSSITSLADVSGGPLTPESLRQRLEDGETATQALITDLKGLDPPNIEAGAQLEQQLDAAADGLQGNFDALKAEAKAALDASSPAEFLRGLATLAPDYQLLLNQIEITIVRLVGSDVPEDVAAELERAFADAESCQALSAENG